MLKPGRLRSVEGLIISINRSTIIDDKIFNHFNLLFPANRLVSALSEKEVSGELKESLELRKSKSIQELSDLKNTYITLSHLRVEIFKILTETKEPESNPIKIAKETIQELVVKPFKDSKLAFRKLNELKLIQKMIIRLDKKYLGTQASSEKQ